MLFRYRLAGGQQRRRENHDVKKFYLDIKTVQHLLGHADITSTMVYLHVTNKLIGLARSPLDEISGKPDDFPGKPEDWNKGGNDA